MLNREICRMFLRLIVLAVFCLSGVGSVDAELWINEFHYDNAGGDSGEFVEIVVSPSMTSGLDLSSVAVNLINGSNGDSYGSASLLGITPTTTNGFDFYSLLISGIQNGAPDGIFLSFPGGNQFLSYEGVISPTSGPADGLTSTDIGIEETTSTPIGSSLGLIGSGSIASDFAWAVISDDTPGAINVGQTVVAVPEPSSFLIIAIVGSFGIAFSRGARQTIVSALRKVFLTKN